MKRSEINTLMEHAKTFFDDHKFCLPPWAFWKPEDWAGRKIDCREIIENQMGWDITDFGSGDFAKKGLLLFTIRNGNPASDHKPYAEKIMIVGEQQETPMHFHWQKMEDIINRGGGNLVIELYRSTQSEDLSDEPLNVQIDGVTHQVQAGGKVKLEPGESITLDQTVYHRFYGEAGKGRVLVGEVSQVNDDSADNRFHKPAGRFPDIEEDTPPLHLLLGDYPKYVTKG
jgi:D-lyxose ketol-isomerase